MKNPKKNTTRNINFYFRGWFGAGFGIRSYQRWPVSRMWDKIYTSHIFFWNLCKKLVSATCTYFFDPSCYLGATAVCGLYKGYGTMHHRGNVSHFSNLYLKTDGRATCRHYPRRLGAAYHDVDSRSKTNSRSTSKRSSDQWIMTLEEKAACQ